MAGIRIVDEPAGHVQRFDVIGSSFIQVSTHLSQSHQTRGVARETAAKSSTRR